MEGGKGELLDRDGIWELIRLEGGSSVEGKEKGRGRQFSTARRGLGTTLGGCEGVVGDNEERRRGNKPTGS